MSILSPDLQNQISGARFTFLVVSEFLSCPHLISSLEKELSSKGNVQISTFRPIDYVVMGVENEKSKFPSYFDDLWEGDYIIVDQVEIFNREECLHKLLPQQRVVFVVPQGVEEEELEKVDQHWKEHSYNLSPTSIPHLNFYLGYSTEGFQKEDIMNGIIAFYKEKTVVFTDSPEYYHKQLENSYPGKVISVRGSVNEKKERISAFNEMSTGFLILKNIPLREVYNVGAVIFTSTPSVETWLSLRYLFYRNNLLTRPGDVTVLIFVQKGEEEKYETFRQFIEREYYNGNKDIREITISGDSSGGLTVSQSRCGIK